MANSNIYPSVFTGDQIDARLAAIPGIQESVASFLAYLADYYTKEQIDSIVASLMLGLKRPSAVTAATLPAASASTLGKIYYVGPSDGIYTLYVTYEDGENYAWLTLGTTEISLEDYTLQSDFDRLDADVNGGQQESKTAIDVSGIDAVNRYITSGNTWNSGNNARGIFVPVTPGKKYGVIFPSEASHGAVTKDTSITIGNTPNFATGYDARVAFSAAEEYVFVAPVDAVYIFISTRYGSTTYKTFTVYEYGSQHVDGLVDRVNDIEAVMGKYEQKVDNNLQDDGPAEGWTITAEDGTAAAENYGQDNVIYTIPVPAGCTKMHARFRFQLTRYLDYPGAVNKQRIFGIPNVARAALDQRTAFYDSVNGRINRLQYVTAIGTSTVQYRMANAEKEDELSGPVAYSIQYVGAATEGLTLRIGLDDVTLFDANDDVVETIAIAEGSTLDAAIDAINASVNLRATPYQTAGINWEDVWHRQGTIPVLRTAGDVIIYYPRIMHNKEWHTFEAVWDANSGVFAWCLDGYTVKTTPYDGTPSVVEINGASGISAYNNTPIRVRDLHLCFDSWEDAEIVSVPPVSSGSSISQLISDWHPHLIIFEGHGIEVKRESDPISNDMNTSTDRLRTIFETCVQRGYRPVTWPEVMDWKVGQGTLPKRCFAMMFDDFRIENYMNQQQRAPFIQYDVRPGLAIITSNNKRTDTVTIDGETWTLAEVFDAIIKGGWYPCSHTVHHTVMNADNLAPADVLPFLKDCVNGCEHLGIYDNILVYPQGTVTNAVLYAMNVSDFSLCIAVENAGYLCKRTNRYYMLRTDIGARKSLSSVLNKII